MRSMTRTILYLLPALFLLHGCAAGVILATTAAAGGAATVVINDRRPVSIQAKDTHISHHVANLLAEDAAVANAGRISVDTYNRIVLLTGEAESDAIKQRAGELANSHSEVRSVYNKLRVMPPNETSDQVRQNDFLTSTKIKATLLKEEGMGGLHTQVTTENGVAYLMGLLTREEARQVIELVRRVEGVQKVVPLFEYIKLVPAE